MLGRKSGGQSWVNCTALAALVFGLSFAAEVYAGDAPPLDCQPGTVCKEPKTELPARVLTRPFSLIYKEKRARQESVLSDKTAPFSPLYVFAREDLDFSHPNDVKGWYQVGVSATGTPLGWMLAKDVIEWRQALVLAFTHPGVGAEARQRAIFFDGQDQLDRLTQLDDEARKAKTQTLYVEIERAIAEKGNAPDGVVSIEGPYVDIKDHFYMLPILQFEDLGSLFVDESKIVQVVAVSESRAAPGETTFKQSSASSQDATTVAGAAHQQPALQDLSAPTPTASASSKVKLSDLPGAAGGSDLAASHADQLQDLPAGAMTTAGIQALKELGADIVFVMDMTGSMAPFVESATNAIREVAQATAQDPELANKVRFGFIGYRDDVRKMPNVQFTAKNFTQDETLKVDDFLKVMESVGKDVADFAARQEGSGDYQEEMFAGVKAALSTKWNEPSVRFVVLVGDASSHEVFHEQNTTGMDEVTLRQQLNTEKINLLALHLKDDRAVSDHALAERQFSALATNEGVQKALYYPIPATNIASYNQVVKDITSALTEVMRAFRKGDVKMAAVVEPSPSMSTSGASTVKADVARLGYAAALSYLGKVQGAQPPKDFLAWAFDRDLIEPAKLTLQVRALLTRQQINDLVFTAERVSAAIQTAKLTQLEFFEALQSVTLVGVKGQEIDYSKVQALKGSGLAAAWLESLPYKSAVLNLNDEMYAAMSPDDRAQIENGLKAKLQLYRDLLANADIWIRPREDSPNEDRFYPLELSSLP